MNAYPDLGSDAAPKDSADEDSVRDQSVAGLTRLNDEDHAAFGDLTTQYRARFGIPLIVSVRDDDRRAHILSSGLVRLHNSPTQEHAAALIEIAKIANYRFDEQVAEANPIATARIQQFDQLGN